MTLTFDLLTMTVFHIQCFSCPTHIPILIILSLSVTEIRLLNLIIFTLSETVTAHAPCHVVYNRGGGKNSPHCWNPWPYCRGYKVHCACAISRDLYITSLPKPHVTIFDPKLLIHYTTFMELRSQADGRPPCINGDIAIQWEWSNFDPLTESKPLNRLQ